MNIPQAAEPSIRAFYNQSSRPAPARGESSSTPRQTISHVADVLNIVLGLVECPTDLWPFVFAVVGAAGGETRAVPLNSWELGRRMAGQENGRSDDALAKRSQRARDSYEEWQNASGYKLLTWLRGGQDRSGENRPTEYDLPILELAAETLARAREHSAWKRGPSGRERAIDAAARPLLAALHAPKQPTVRERHGLRRGNPNDPARLLKTALTLFGKARDLAADPDAITAEFCRRAGLSWPVQAPSESTDSCPISLREERTEGPQGGDALEGANGSELEGPPEWLEPEEPPEWMEFGPVGGGAFVPPSPNNDGGLEAENGANRAWLEAVDEPAESARALEAFAGASSFLVVYVDDRAKANGEPADRGATTEPADVFARKLRAHLERSERERLSLCVRPASPNAVQVDDCGEELARDLAPLAFAVFETSPSSYQAWLELDAADAGEADATKARLFERLKPTGANRGASGSIRWPGSRNWKSERRQADGSYPMVRVVYSDPGRVVSSGELEASGWLAEARSAEPAPSVAPSSTHRQGSGRRTGASPEARGWPDYRRELGRTPVHPEGHARAGLPNRSATDYRWAYKAVDRGWSVDAVVSKLLSVSERAAAAGASYAWRTVNRAAMQAAARGN